MDLIVKMILIGLIIFIIIFFIFGLARIDWSTNIEEALKLYRSEVVRTEKVLEINNNKINCLESKIMKCKKRLKMNVFNTKK